MRLFRLLYLLILCLLIPAESLAYKRALLIGVSNYPKESGWCKLASCNDIALLKETLSEINDITCLVDENATKKGIDSALKKQREVLWYLQCLNQAFYRIAEFKKQEFVFCGGLEEVENIYNDIKMVKDAFKFFEVDSFYKLMEESMKRSREFVKKTESVTDDWYEYEIDNLREETQKYYDWVEHWINENVDWHFLEK